jgi:nitrate/nitrite-specific signal transduction histidine kinase
LIESYARSNHAYKRAIKILEYKHALNLELTSANEHDTLLEKLAELPGKFVGAEETYILMRNPESEDWNTASHWVKSDNPNQAMVWNPKIPCQKCLTKSTDNKEMLHLCRYDDVFPFNAYSLALTHRGFPTTIIKFRLEMGARLNDDEEELFNNLGDEIITALQTSQDRKNLIAMQSAEAAMAERRVVSAFVHDQLAQNLGFLHLKLDQFSASKEFEEPGMLQATLLQLRDVANESYEIVRDILKKIQPETVPHLTNLLLEQSRTVSRRAKFTLDFKTTGKSLPIAPNIQQPIFFTFCEILSNIEKHARAEKVEVLVMWNNDGLDISIADDGVGFDANTVRREGHFGLEITQERVQKLNGKVFVDSRVGKGTMVSISIPLKTNSEAPA